MATYTSTHVIDEIGLWQLETKSRVPEQEQGGGGEGGQGLAKEGGRAAMMGAMAGPWGGAQYLA